MKKCFTSDVNLKMKVNVKMILFIRNCVYLRIPSLKGVSIIPFIIRITMEINFLSKVYYTYDATKMDGAYSDGIVNNTPLFHQMFVNI